MAPVKKQCFQERNGFLTIKVEHLDAGMEIGIMSSIGRMMGLKLKTSRIQREKLDQDPKIYNFTLENPFTWSDITSGSFSGRFSPQGSIFDVQGSSAFPDRSILLYLLGFMNSSVSQEILKMLNPTLHTQVGDLSRLPVVIDQNLKPGIENLVKHCIALAKMIGTVMK
jgi:hypothetical protein